ncbi:hypothetical protein OF83DRAFT_649106 [Amylostereum chailletii]|nr:hypothetical protein OF83DRAFT_649106 [Amylostereum chailletii]
MASSEVLQTVELSNLAHVFEANSHSSPDTLGSPTSRTHSPSHDISATFNNSESKKLEGNQTEHSASLGSDTPDSEDEDEDDDDDDDDDDSIVYDKRKQHQQFPISSPLGSPHRSAATTPPRRAAPSNPYSPIIIDSSPEPGQPNLDELLRSTQPPPVCGYRIITVCVTHCAPQPPPSQTPNATAPKKVKPTPRRVVVGSSQASSQSHLNLPGKRKATTPISDDLPSAHSQPLLKRPRLQKTHARRHPVFWNLDGSVVIQTGDVMFKLHRSRLVKQSNFFAALFDRKGKQVAKGDGSQIELDETEMVEPEMLDDGCPLYRVSRVSSEDFEQLLTVLDDFTDYMDEAPSFSVLASIIRATTFLSFNKLRTWAVRILERMWSDKLDELYADTIPHAAATVALAHQCDIPRVYKRAYYELLRTPEFGQGALEDNDEADENNPGQLSLVDYRRLVKAREGLTIAWVAAAAKVPDLGCRHPLKSKVPHDSGSGPATAVDAPLPDPACLSTNLPNADTEWVDVVHESGVFEQYLHDPILGMVELMDFDWAASGWCTECALAWHAAWKRQKEKLWQNLDLWLKLPPVD